VLTAKLPAPSNPTGLILAADGRIGRRDVDELVFLSVVWIQKQNARERLLRLPRD